MKGKNHMGIDQYGQTYHDLGPHPRKALLEKLGKSKAEKMYVDDGMDGTTFHTGYIIGGLWITLYRVIPFMKKI